MKVLFDTSVLTPILTDAHPNHARVRPWVERAGAGQIVACTCVHCLAEAYSNLTGSPESRRMPTAHVATIIADLTAWVTPIELTAADYIACLHKQASLGTRGGSIYDALVVVAAQKAGVDRILTFNISHFHRVWPEGKDIISAPT